MNLKIVLRITVINNSFQYNDMTALRIINDVLNKRFVKEKGIWLFEAVNCCITSYLLLVILQTALFQMISSLSTFQKYLMKNKGLKQVSITSLNIVAITKLIKNSFH